MIDKTALLEQLIHQLERKSEGIGKVAENVRQDMIAAEGRMQTRYGSEKEETGYLADGLALRKHATDSGLGLLLGLKLPQKPVYVINGSLVSVSEDPGEVDRYFILPYGGGESLETKQGEVVVVTPVAPIARLMFNKRAGDQFSFGMPQRRYRVVDIQ